MEWICEVKNLDGMIATGDNNHVLSWNADSLSNATCKYELCTLEILVHQFWKELVTSHKMYFFFRWNVYKFISYNQSLFTFNMLNEDNFGNEDI